MSTVIFGTLKSEYLPPQLGCSGRSDAMIPQRGAYQRSKSAAYSREKSWEVRSGLHHHEKMNTLYQQSYKEDTI